ncbi:MAG: hypothetical protein JXJ17_14315 [Anaerolineae bacterium]|nr:hypothetical protein [Anaerolineae bacterium]
MDFGSLFAFVYFGAIALFVVIVIVAGVRVAARKKAAQKPLVVDGVEISPPRRNPGSLSDEKIIDAYRKMPIQVRNFGFVLIGLAIFNSFVWFSQLLMIEEYPGLAIAFPASLVFLLSGVLALFIREPASMGLLYLVFIADSIRQFILYRQNFNIWQLISIIICLMFFVFFLTQRNIFYAYTTLPEEMKSVPVTNRADRVFPIVSILSGGASIFVVLAAIVLMVVFGSGPLIGSVWFGLFTSLGLILGIFAAALGASGLYYGLKQQRALLIIGLLTGAVSIYFLF